MPTTYLAIGASGALTAIALFAFGIIHIPEQRAEATPAPQTAAATSIQYAPGPTVPVTKPAGEGRRSYENSAYRFTLVYPDELTVNEYDEADGAMSVTFKNEATGRAFQVYITPYRETEITPDRLALDLPSGYMRDVSDIVLDGARGTSFFSTNSAMGETREIWVINGGYLYEIVTYRQFADWLETILQEWTFL